LEQILRYRARHLKELGVCFQIGEAQHRHAALTRTQQLAGLRAVEIDHAAELTIVRSGYADLAHFLAALDVSDDVGVHAVGRNIETPDRAGQRREGMVRGIAALGKFSAIVLAVPRRELVRAALGIISGSSRTDSRRGGCGCPQQEGTALVDKVF